MKNRCKEPLLRFSLCWLICRLLFFSASRGKLIPYILPCFPPLIVIILMGLFTYLGRGNKKAFTLGGAILATILGLAGGG